jgi:hypothetical protein
VYDPCEIQNYLICDYQKFDQSMNDFSRADDCSAMFRDRERWTRLREESILESNADWQFLRRYFDDVHGFEHKQFCEGACYPALSFSDQSWLEEEFYCYQHCEGSPFKE